MKNKIHRALKIEMIVGQMKTDPRESLAICLNLKSQVTFDVFGLEKLCAGK